jgi:alcohol dehydrogenase class IV
LLVCSEGAANRPGFLDPILASLHQAGVTFALFAQVRGEPTLDLVEAGIDEARRENVQLVIGIGGGSAIDAAKAVAGLSRQPGSVEEYHRGRTLENPASPLIAVPTVAGSGAEVTLNAVLSDPQRQFKASIRGKDWYPDLALVDPALTISVPPAVTASGGSDALCQAIEAHVSIGASPATQALTSQAIQLISRSLVPAYRHGDDLAARSDLLYGSLLAGMALVNARLGGVHGLAHPLGIRFGIPHGVICGLLLPYFMRYNLPRAEADYAQIAHWVGVDTRSLSASEAAKAAADQVSLLLEQIDLPSRLRDFGITEGDYPTIIQEALPSGSLKHNPRPLDATDLRTVLTAAW